MKSNEALFQRINNAVLDLQRSDYQSFHRPYRVLVQALDADELRPITSALTKSIDLDAFLAESKKTIGGMVGSGHLSWPEEQDKYLGTCLLLLRKFRDKPDDIFGFLFTYFHSSGMTQTLRKFVSNLVIPFVRDFTTFARENLPVQEVGKNGASQEAVNSNIHIHNFQGVLGNVSNSTLSQNLHMSVVENDLDALITHLRSQGVGTVELVELKDAIDADPRPVEPRKFGAHVSAWVGKMVSLSAAGAWNVSIGAAGNLLATAIGKYYGFPTS